MYALPPVQLDIIIGLILGDAWLIIVKKSRSINAKLGFKQSTINLASFCSVFCKLSHYCNCLPYLNKNMLRDKLFHVVTFQTRGINYSIPQILY